MNSFPRLLSALLAALSVGTLAHAGTRHQCAVPDTSYRPKLAPDRTAKTSGSKADLSGIPLTFERNEGQTDRQVKFLARGGGYTLFLTGKEAVLSLKRGGKAKPGQPSGAVLRMAVEGSAASKVQGEAPLATKIHYLVGNDRSKWRTNVRTFSRVAYDEVYPGIDLVYHGRQGRLEYDFIVQPGADPGDIRLKFTGAENARLDGEGNLVLKVAGTEVRQPRPVLYQDTGSGRKAVPGRFVMLARADEGYRVGFKTGAYDPDLPLVIDPIITYSTFLGGRAGDQGFALAGSCVAGTTSSDNFPPGRSLPVTSADAFVACLDTSQPSAQQLVFATYFGGGGDDVAYGIRGTSEGIHLVGSTTSSNFSGASNYGGGQDGFFITLAADGSAVRNSTYIGGSGLDSTYGIAMDASEDLWIAGETRSTNLLTFQAQQSTLQGSSDAMVARYTRFGQKLYLSYLGGSSDEAGYSVAWDFDDPNTFSTNEGGAWLTGFTRSTNFPSANNALSGTQDAFVIKLHPTSGAPIYSTLLGGAGSEVGYGIAADFNHNPYVTGVTNSPGFPTTPTGVMGQVGAADASLNNNGQGPATDAFLTKLTPFATNRLGYSTFFGGSGDDAAYGISVSTADYVVIGGETRSPDLPRLYNEESTADAGLNGDGFVATFNTAGTCGPTLTGAAYLGGAYYDTIRAVQGSGVTGYTSSGNFPVVGNSGGQVHDSTLNDGGFPSGPFDAFYTVITPRGPSLVKPVVQGTGISSSAIRLDWQDQQFEDGYRVYRHRFIYDQPELIANLQQNTVTYTDTGRAAGTAYHYYVVAYNCYEERQSDTIHPATQNGTPPTPVLTLLSANSTGVTLRWTDDGDNEVTFRVERSQNGGAFSEISQRPTNNTAYVIWTDYGILPGNSYIYRVRAVNSLSQFSPYSNTVTATIQGPPAAPTNLRASASGTVSGSIVLRWTDNSANENAFRIERKVGSGSYSEIGTTFANATTYTDPNLVLGTTYTYRVRASNEFQSAYSNEASATAGAPADPDYLFADPLSATQMRVTWADSSNNEQGFKLERKTGSGAFSEIASLGANATQFDDSGLTPNTSYTYRLRAYNTYGTSNWVEYTRSTPPLIPAAPTDLTAAPTTGVNIDLRWTDNSTDEAYWQVERSTDNVNFTTVKWVPTSTGPASGVQTSSWDTVPTVNTTFYYRVRASNAAGVSGYSNVVSVFNGPPAPPNGIAADPWSTTSVMLYWIDLPNETHYQIHRSTDGVSFSLLATVNPNNVTYLDSGLVTRQRYYYKFRAGNEAGYSAFSPVVSARPGIPTRPLDLTVSAATLSQVNLTWTDTSDNETGFRVYRGTSSGSLSQIASTGANATSYTDNSVSANNTYYYKVAAYNAFGEDPSNTVSVTVAIPPAPANPTVQISGGKLYVSWTDQSPNEAGFKVERALDGTNFTLVHTTGPNVTQYADTSATPGRVYTYRITAFNNLGSSSTVSTSYTWKFSTPLPWASVNNGSVSLSWYDDSTGEQGFRLERSVNGGAWSTVQTLAPDTSSYEDGNVVSPRTYAYRLTVLASDPAANSDAGEVTIKYGPPPTPLNFRLTAGLNYNQLNWDPAGNNEEGFEIWRSGNNGDTWNKIGTRTASLAIDWYYRDANVVPGKRYWYKIRAYNALGKSAYTPVLSIITYDPN